MKIYEGYFGGCEVPVKIGEFNSKLYHDIFDASVVEWWFYG